MMRFFILFITVIFSTAPGLGLVKNPMIRICHFEVGEFKVYNNQSFGEVSFCFFQSAAVGAETLMLYKTSQAVPQAVRAYLSYHVHADAVGICTQYGAEAVYLHNSEFDNFSSCLFPDGSWIDATALSVGHGHWRNLGLDKALSATY